ncbi:hypothetical protein EDC14_100764 [Hydrogenispora ethanolica]|uniref:Uncharacterized protein n=1 Tax=Hydrogenispora ethanolica TaxID=1082276 RepID=A0A4R1S010_HYDET|nr:hypothetical protein EDC14_100764 [Hydrogenispora ethanolica]
MLPGLPMVRSLVWLRAGESGADCLWRVSRLSLLRCGLIQKPPHIPAQHQLGNGRIGAQPFDHLPGQQRDLIP